MTKVVMNGEDAKAKINTCAVLVYVLRAILKLLHPFAPFVTEDIYQMFNEGSITVSSWPKALKEYDFEDSLDIEQIYDIITAVRNTRAVKNVSMSKPISLVLQLKDNSLKEFIENNTHYLQRFTNYEDLKLVIGEYDTAKCQVTVLNNITVIIPLDTLVNLEEEKAKLLQEKQKMENEIKRCSNMLSNPSFVSKAPAAKVEEEKRKLNEYQEKLDKINQLLSEF
jgi:valyl-tRNA synthetase